MNHLIVAIRPEPGCSATVIAGQAAGLAITASPLSEIRALEWSLPPGEFDGVLLGSANALRHGGPLVDNLVDKPVYAVGISTAAEARRRGFTVAQTGSGGLQSLLDTMAGRDLRLLRITGREHVRLQPPPGIALETAIAYESHRLAMSGPLAGRLRQGGLVLLHSAATALHFADECDRLAVPREAIALAALGPRIAKSAGAGWAAVGTAMEPSDAALLALVRDMCHEPPPG